LASCARAAASDDIIKHPAAQAVVTAFPGASVTLAAKPEGAA
jgi:hypothetical protein